jgi:hypothetical protein
VKRKLENTNAPLQGETLVTIDIFGLARAMSLAPGTCKNRLSRGAPMPPSITVGKRRMWLITTVIEWLRARERMHGDQNRSSMQTPSAHARPPHGRKQKASSIERRRQMLSALEQRSGAQGQ